MLSEELENKIDNEIQEYINLNYDNLTISDVGIITDVKNMVVNVLEKNNLVELPCKVGSKVYLVYAYCGIIADTIGKDCEIREETVDGFEIFYTNNKPGISLFAGDKYLSKNDYNKTWFTDKTLAEQKLEELENE